MEFKLHPLDSSPNECEKKILILRYMYIFYFTQFVSDWPEFTNR